MLKNELLRQVTSDTFLDAVRISWGASKIFLKSAFSKSAFKCLFLKIGNALQGFVNSRDVRRQRQLCSTNNLIP